VDMLGGGGAERIHPSAALMQGQLCCSDHITTSISSNTSIEIYISWRSLLSSVFPEWNRPVDGVLCRVCRLGTTSLHYTARVTSVAQHPMV